MSELSVLLSAFDDAWSHRWESLQEALRGVTDEEAFWQAPAYAAEEPEEDWPAPGSVAWQVAHVAHCKRYYADILLHAEGGGRAEVRRWPPCTTYAELRGRLEDAHRAQRAAAAGLGDERLDRIAGNDMPVREFLRMCIRHDTWHAAQIAVARRLFRAR